MRSRFVIFNRAQTKQGYEVAIKSVQLVVDGWSKPIERAEGTILIRTGTAEATWENGKVVQVTTRLPNSWHKMIHGGELDLLEAALWSPVAQAAGHISTQTGRVGKPSSGGAVHLSDCNCQACQSSAERLRQLTDLDGGSIWHPDSEPTSDPNLHSAPGVVKCECGSGSNVKSPQHYKWCPLFEE